MNDAQSPDTPFICAPSLKISPFIFSFHEQQQRRRATRAGVSLSLSLSLLIHSFSLITPCMASTCVMNALRSPHSNPSTMLIPSFFITSTSSLSLSMSRSTPPNVFVDVVLDNVSIATTQRKTLAKANVIFCSIFEAIKKLLKEQNEESGRVRKSIASRFDSLAQCIPQLLFVFMFMFQF